MGSQTLIIATLLSLIAWVGISDATRSGYREAGKVHLILDLHLHERLGLLQDHSTEVMRLTDRHPRRCLTPCD
ncbi:hypothetical protein SAMN05880582_10996 [Rhizobium sp. RU20A]|nr:hypothetical protein SAMN05880582_10996 [Rhizobium sp. RU20A]